MFGGLKSREKKSIYIFFYNFKVLFEHTENLVLFLVKDVYGKYLSYAPPRGYIACFGAQVFKFPWRVIFGAEWAETKTGGQIQPTPGAQIQFFAFKVLN